MKKTMSLCAITFVIVGLLISSAASMSISSDIETSASVKELNKEMKTLTATSQKASMKYLSKPLTGEPYQEQVSDQLHPAIANRGSNQIFASWDQDVGDVVYCYSTDNGQTLEGGIFYDNGADYPTLDYWKGATGAVGTFTCDYLDGNGGVTYVFSAEDFTDTETYSLIYNDWSAHGWSNMIDSSYAGGVREGADFFTGVGAAVMDTTYGSGYTAGAFIFFKTDDTGSTIGWYDVNFTEHCDVAIDSVTKYSIAVFDMYNQTSDDYELFFRADNTADMNDEEDPVGAYVINSERTLQKPSVAANDDNILIAVESDGTIAVLYSHTGPMDEFSEINVGTGENPVIEHVVDDQYVLIFNNGESLYKSLTEDAGASWSTPEEIADGFVDEYKGACLSDGAGFALYGFDGAEDADIYRAEVFHIPTPIIELGEISGGFGKINAVVSNSGDAAAENVDWDIAVEGGLVFGGSNQGTFQEIGVGEDVTLQSKFIFGFGGLTATISVDAITQTVDGSVLLLFVNI